MTKFLLRLLCAAMLVFCAAGTLHAASLTVAWNANTEANIAGYAVRYGVQPGVYTHRIDVGNRIQYTIGGLPAGTYFVVVEAYNVGGEVSLPSAMASGSATILPATFAPDLDADQVSDLAIWRPSNGTWYWLSSSAAFSYGQSGGKQWGASGDVPLSGDLDGDRVADLIVWRPSTGTWFWLTSSSGYNYAAAGGRQWGNQALGDVPMLADIDGDRLADLIVWRASTGTWHWLTSSSGYAYAAAGGKQWGNQALGDVPFIGDYDGDGLADLTVWRASTGTWNWLTSSTFYNYANAAGLQWGNSGLGDRPLVGDVDGDQKSDLTVWRESSGTWFTLTSSSGYAYASAVGVQWGNKSLGDIPSLVDVDGDRRADLCVWRESTGTWFWLKSSAGYSYSAAGGVQWGSAGDIPIVK